MKSLREYMPIRSISTDCMNPVSTLDTGIRNTRNVGRYLYGPGTLSDLKEIVGERRGNAGGEVVFFMDSYFEKHGLPKNLDAIESRDIVVSRNCKGFISPNPLNLCILIFDFSSS